MDRGRGKNRGHDAISHSHEIETSDVVRTPKNTQTDRADQVTEVWQNSPKRVKLKLKSERQREMKSVSQ